MQEIHEERAIINSQEEQSQKRAENSGCILKKKRNERKIRLKEQRERKRGRHS